MTTIDAGSVCCDSTAVRCVSGEGQDTVLDGFTITGSTSVTGAMFNDASSPTVTNCTFYGNFGAGGMLNRFSSPTVSNCSFSGNAALLGGGMRNISSSPTVTDCAFDENSAGIGGGGMSNSDARPIVTGCTFSGNSALSTGGGVFSAFGSSPTLTNCILWDDTPDEIDLLAATTTASYSDIQGGWSGIGNIDVDPLFVDSDNGNLRLSPGSPCIDAGDNSGVPKGVHTDLDGDPRFVDDPGTIDNGSGDPPIVDMGAYEFQ